MSPSFDFLQLPRRPNMSLSPGYSQVIAWWTLVADPEAYSAGNYRGKASV